LLAVSRRRAEQRTIQRGAFEAGVDPAPTCSRCRRRHRQARATPVEGGLVPHEIWLLRLRALLAHAQGDEVAYRDYRDRYGAMATSLRFEGHMKWAEEMT
jgi:hypothetical protein